MSRENYEYLSNEIDDIMRCNSSCVYFGLFTGIYTEKLLRLLYKHDITAEEYTLLFDRINPGYKEVSKSESAMATKVISNYRRKFKQHYEIFQENPDYLRATNSFVKRVSKVYEKDMCDDMSDYLNEVSKLINLFVKIVPTSTYRFTDLVIYNKLLTVLFSFKSVYTVKHLHELMDSIIWFYQPLTQPYSYLGDIINLKRILKHYRDKYGYVEEFKVDEPVGKDEVPYLKSKVEQCFNLYGNEGFLVDIDNEVVMITAHETIIDILKYGVTFKSYDKFNQLLYNPRVSSFVYDHYLDSINSYVDFLVSKKTSLMDGLLNYVSYGNRFRMYMSLKNIRLNKEVIDYYNTMFDIKFIKEFCLSRTLYVYSKHSNVSDVYYDHVLAISTLVFYKAGLLPDALDFYNLSQKTGTKSSIEELELMDDESAHDILGMNRSEEAGGVVFDTDGVGLYVTDKAVKETLDETDIF